MSQVKYRRILLKVSGEALAGEKRRGLDFDIINHLCDSIQECTRMGVQIGLVIGAGNFWRGGSDAALPRGRDGNAWHRDERHRGG